MLPAFFGPIGGASQRSSQPQLCDELATIVAAAPPSLQLRPTDPPPGAGDSSRFLDEVRDGHLDESRGCRTQVRVAAAPRSDLRAARGDATAPHGRGIDEATMAYSMIFSSGLNGYKSWRPSDLTAILMSSLSDTPKNVVAS